MAAKLCYERAQQKGAERAPDPTHALSDETRSRGGKKSTRTTARVWKEIT